MLVDCHLSRLPYFQAHHRGRRTAIAYRDDATGRWVNVSWNEFAATVRRTSLAMLACGVEEQEVVAVLSPNKPECLYADFAVFGIRAVSVPIYATSAPHQIGYMLRETEARFLFVGGQEQLTAALSIVPACNKLEHIVLFDKNLHYEPNPLVKSFDDFLAQSKNGDEALLEKRLMQAADDDIANILYTSGTTDVSKGVVLTHRMYRTAFIANAAVLPLSRKDVALNILPFSHIFERAWCFLGLLLGVKQCINLNPANALQSMREVRPTCLCAVPRFWEKIYQGIEYNLRSVSPRKREMLWGAVLYGQSYWREYTAKRRRAPLRRQFLRWALDRLFFLRIRKALGLGRANFFPTSGAAVSPEIALLARGIGLRMLVGYGMTESTATVSLDHLDEPVTLGSVGRPLEGLGVKLASNGEILLKGDTITPGYFKKPAATARTIDKEGWFHTGDAGYMQGGQLYLLDRLKDLYKTSNGKYVAPGLIEARLTPDSFIEQVCLVAEKRKFVTALVVPQLTQLREVAAKRHWLYRDDKDLCEHPEANAFMLERIKKRLASMAHHEQVQRIALISEPFTVENGLLTATMKVRRRPICARYAELIDRLYAAQS